jgi:hypothetical protein
MQPNQRFISVGSGLGHQQYANYAGVSFLYAGFFPFCLQDVFLGFKTIESTTYQRWEQLWLPTTRWRRSGELLAWWRFMAPIFLT